MPAEEIILWWAFFFAFGTREHYGTLIAYISLINTIFYML
jgi:hypothetical protein